MNDLKLIQINTVLFFCGWTVIFLAGADFPPPIGFLWLILLILVLDLIQYKYLKYFIPQLRKRKKYLFFKNLLFFTIGSVIIGIFTVGIGSIINLPMDINDIIVWITALTAIGFIYSILFWFFNVLLLKFFRK